LANDFLTRALISLDKPASEYADLVMGTVTTTEPLKIQIDERTFIPAELLKLSRSVTEHQVKINGELVTIDGRLEAGDAVVLIRGHGGQMFFVLEKAV